MSEFIDLLKRTLAAMDKGYMGRNHAEYLAVMEELKAALAAPEPQPVKQAEQIKSLREALKAVLAVANVRIDDARIGVFDDARAALALVGDQP